MNKPEEYVIVDDNINNVVTINVDGPYYTTIKQRMTAKFSKQPNPEERVKTLEENARDIFGKILTVEKCKKDKNILLVGKVQSGKTSNMQMSLALAFDNGYNMMIMYAGYDNTLVDQAIDRFSNEAFKKPDSMDELSAKTEWVNIFTTRDGKGHPIEALDDDTVESIISDGGKIIFMCLKSPDSINKITDLLSSLDLSNIKPIIFDDEGDQASLNNEFRKNNESATYKSICKMKEVLNDPPYLSVTATPQALVFSPETSRLKPRLLQLIHPGEGYTGLNAFHFNADRIIDVDDELDDYISREKPKLPPSLWDALYAYFVSSAIIIHKHILTDTQMIIHFDKLTAKHEIVYNLVSQYLDGVQKNIKNNQFDTLDKKLIPMEEVFSNSDFIDKDLKKDITFGDIKNDLIKVLRTVYPALMNAKGKDTMAKLAWKHFQIRIGADLLQRGVTFDTLITTYFTRWPKGNSNMDTQIQRARWLGYRSKYFDYCHVITTNEIDYSFSKLAEAEADLWSQMLEVEGGIRTLDEIIVEADPKMRPSRRSAADFSIKTFGRKWLNQSIGLSDKDTVNKNNEVIENIVSRHIFRPISDGCTDLDPNRITAYKAILSFDELKELLEGTSDIFTNLPFDSVNKILKIAQGIDIDLLVFWDATNNSLLKTHRFDSELRTRSFKYVEGAYRVSALQQGADKVDVEKRKYLGDASVINNRSALTIQVFPIMPKPKQSPEAMNGKFQYMYSIHTPTAVSVYTKGGGK